MPEQEAVIRSALAPHFGLAFWQRGGNWLWLLFGLPCKDGGLAKKLVPRRHLFFEKITAHEPRRRLIAASDRLDLVLVPGAAAFRLTRSYGRAFHQSGQVRWVLLTAGGNERLQIVLAAARPARK
jgi:hypothetical protein